MGGLEIIQLNHASMLIVTGEVRLLTDPWFEGEAFNGGWGLRWRNPEAYALAATATHVWISHPHSDHLHYATLKKLQSLNPDVTVLVNRAYNYDLQGMLTSLGFRHLQVIEENTPLTVGGCTLERIGSGMIDSMLFIDCSGYRILNLNDCVPPCKALSKLVRQKGGIDLLLCNFNHASKLYQYPLQPVEQTVQRHFLKFKDICEAADARYVIPFASFHQYLLPFSIEQNASLMEPRDLLMPNAPFEVLALYPGQFAHFNCDHGLQLEKVGGNGAPDPVVAAAVPLAGDAFPETELLKAARILEQRIWHAYGFLRLLIPTLNIRITGTGEVFSIRHGKVVRAETGAKPHIEALADKVIYWFSNPFGTDIFGVGAHFRILEPAVTRLKIVIAFLMLGEAKVAPRYLGRVSLWKLLFARRREIWPALQSCWK